MSEAALHHERPALKPESEAPTLGSAIVYRLYDVGYEIHLGSILELLAASAPQRPGPTRVEAQAIQILNPPVQAVLGREEVLVADQRFEAEMSARVFDFGVVSLRLRIDTPAGISWPAFSRFGGNLNLAALAPLFERYLAQLLDRIRPAIERPAMAPVT